MRLYDFLINPLRSIKNSPATGAYMFGRILSPRERIYVCTLAPHLFRYVWTGKWDFCKWARVSSWKRFHGDGNVSRLQDGNYGRMDAYECDSVLARPSRLVRALFRSITHLCESGFYAFVFCSNASGKIWIKFCTECSKIVNSVMFLRLIQLLLLRSLKYSLKYRNFRRF